MRNALLGAKDSGLNPEFDILNDGTVDICDLIMLKLLFEEKGGSGSELPDDHF